MRPRIRRAIATLVNFLLAPFNLQLARKRISQSAKKKTARAAQQQWTALEACLYGLLSARGSLNVLQLGANDGKWSDPIHDFLMRERSSVSALFVEPQPEIAEILSETYRSLERAQIFVGAVAPTAGTVVLYRVRPDLWSSTEMPYLKEAPDYRAPSGFASTNRAHVERHVQRLRWRQSGKSVLIADAVEELTVPVSTLDELRTAYPGFFPVDVLQVDVEGIDDQLVLAALEAGIQPHIVNLEVAHLSPDRRFSLTSRLGAHGYRHITTGADLLAVRRTL